MLFITFYDMLSYPGERKIANIFNERLVKIIYLTKGSDQLLMFSGNLVFWNSICHFLNGEQPLIWSTMKKQIKLLIELVKLREATYTMFEFSTHHVIHKTKCHIKYGREQENCQQYISAPV